MLRRIMLVLAAAAITFFSLAGCKKRTPKPESEQADQSQQAKKKILKTMAEYKTEAEKQITKKNMAEELDKIEKEIAQELTGQP